MTLNTRLQNIIAHGYENAPALRQIMDDAGITPADIQSVTDLPKIPVTTKEQLAKMQSASPPFGGWLAVPFTTLKRIYVSPGPLFEPEGEDVAAQWHSEVFEKIGIGENDLVLNTFMYHLTPAGLRLEAAVQVAGATVIPAGPGNTEYQVQIMMQLGATAYIGTPSFLKIILEKAMEMGIGKTDIPIKKTVFTAEPYPPSLREYFEVGYSMRTAQTYATAELGIIAYEISGDIGMTLSKNMIVEIVDSAIGQPIPAGEPGQVVVTPFNKIYPAIRLGTGDLSAFIGDPNADGVHTKIKGWMGRVGDAIKVRGMFLHPLQLKNALAKFAELERAQAIVTRPDTRDVVLVNVVLKSGAVANDDLRESVRLAISQACRLRIDDVKWVSEEAIPADARTIVDDRKWE